MMLWLVILGMVVVTYGVRLSVMAFLGSASLPESVSRALRYVPPAALAAIVFPALFMPDGGLDVSMGNTRLLAGLAAALVAWLSKSALLAIGVGMVLLWVLNWLL
jgi:branched-subunit amino acid transport protein